MAILINTCLIVNIETLTSSFEITLPSNCSICFYIDDPNEDFIQAFRKYLYTKEVNFPFFIGVGSANYLSEEIILEYILPVTFHYKYVQQSFETPLIALSKDYTIQSAKLISDIFMKQGYEGIKIINFPQAALIKNDRNTGDSINIIYDNYFNSVNFSNPLLFIAVDSIESITGTMDKLEKAEEQSLKKYPQVAGLLKQLQECTFENKRISFETGKLKKKLDSIQIYNSIYSEPETLNRKRISDIVKFYKNEYEVLPLWYKRFGHVLKVITGKRTFRSLFNDNVKKYKN